MKLPFLLFVCIVVIAIKDCHSQNVDTILVSGEYVNRPLPSILEELGNQHELRFFTKKEWIEGVIVNKRFDKQNLSIVLTSLLDSTDLYYEIVNRHVIVLIKRVKSPLPDTLVVEAEEVAETPRTRSFITPNDGKKELTIKGSLREKGTLKPLEGASVTIDPLNKVVATDSEGRYSFSIPRGTYSFIYKSIGYKQERIRIQLRSDYIINILLKQDSIALKEVVVEADASEVEALISKSAINITEMKKLPAFLGEADVIKSVLMLPGVTTVGEGAAGFNVRGGNVDQNLVLLDEAPLFNPSHFFGFFSAFNPDLVSEATLYKSAIPAYYGGRASSVLDIRLREGSKEKYKVEGGVGLLTSRLAIEGPIAKDRVSFIFGARGAYPNWILKKLPNASLKESRAEFYDFSGKFSFNLNAKNTISLSGYYSKDAFSFTGDTIYSWANAASTIKWNHYFNNHFQSTTTFLISDYNSSVKSSFLPLSFSLSSGITYIEFKENVFFSMKNHKVNFGVSIAQYSVNPGKLLGEKESPFTNTTVEQEKGIETAIYINDEFKLTEKVSLMGGLRISAFSKLGPAQDFVYLSGETRSDLSIADTLSIGNWKLSKAYMGLEPRAALNFLPTPDLSIKIGYSRLRQNVHLISNTAAITPQDIWKSSDEFLKPQLSEQLSAGIFTQFFKKRYELSAEVFYKELKNVVDYKDGAELFLNSNIETELIQGKGRAYGIEVLLRKNLGKLSGSTSYTYSRSLRRFDSPLEAENINSGQYFPANYDRPHDFKVQGNYKLTRRMSVNMNFIYSSGRPVTAPESKYIIDGVVVANYGNRNNVRIPDYHRLDLALTWEGNYKRNKRYQGSLTFGIYNLYSRRNAYSVFYRKEPDSLPGAYQLTVLGSIFPALTYNFKFQ